MDNLIILFVLFAAFLHAFWNFILRGSNNKNLTMTAVVLGHLPLSIIGLVIFGLPNFESLNFIIFSAILHFCYQIVLLNAYKYGELSQVYPVARGLSPLLIVVVTSIFISEKLSNFELFGVLSISISLILYGIKISLVSKINLKGFFFAIITGCFIASYSLVDGYGARITQNPIGFYSSLTILNALLYLLFSIFFQKGIIEQIFTNGKKYFWIGGTASFVAYALVVWAYVYLPIAIVSALRETSIIFAIILSAIFLKERLDLLKILIIAAILFGIIFLKISML